jgi:hypothetical protein
VSGATEDVNYHRRIKPPGPISLERELDVHSRELRAGNMSPNIPLVENCVSRARKVMVGGYRWGYC